MMGSSQRGRTVVKTVVLDDDPTGTQSATGVRVLLRWDAERLAAALADADAVYLQTNSRAVDEAAAVALCAASATRSGSRPTGWASRCRWCSAATRRCAGTCSPRPTSS
jgi:hypothetical protein